MENSISLQERRQIQLKMLDEIDTYCRKNSLRYSLAYGTLIGAIRHYGFIPWDDDVDIMMPMSDYLRFKEGFQSTSIKLCDVDSEKYYDYPFSRLAYRQTFSKTGLITKEYGVNIDLYLIMGISDDEAVINKFFSRANKLLKKRRILKRIRKKLINVLPIHNIPFYTRIVKKYRNCIMEQSVDYNEAKRFFSISGLPDYSSVFDYDLFEEMTDVVFEGRSLMSIGNYDRFLRSQYGDYMKLPPEEDRHPYHGGNYYWK